MLEHRSLLSHGSLICQCNAIQFNAMYNPMQCNAMQCTMLEQSQSQETHYFRDVTIGIIARYYYSKKILVPMVIAETINCPKFLYIGYSKCRPLKALQKQFFVIFYILFLDESFFIPFFFYFHFFFPITSSPMLLYCFYCCSLEFVFIANCNFVEEMFNDSYCSIQVHCISF